MITRRGEAPYITTALFVAGAATLEKSRDDGGNEDAFYIDYASNSAGVFDGLGSYTGSGAASRLASESVPLLLLDEGPRYDADETGLAMESVLRIVNDKVLGLRGPKNNRLATTANVVNIFERNVGLMAVIGHAGDTRASLYRDGHIHSETVDHSFSPDMSASQRLQVQRTISGANSRNEITGLAEYYFKQPPNVSSCLGKDDPEISLMEIYLKTNDIIPILSDGVTANLSSGEITNHINDNADDPQRAADALVEAAHLRSLETGHFRRKEDDITAVVLKIK